MILKLLKLFLLSLAMMLLIVTVIASGVGLYTYLTTLMGV